MRKKIIWSVIVAALLVFAYFTGHKKNDAETARACEAAMKNTLAAKEAEAAQAQRSLEMDRAAQAGAAAPAAGASSAEVGIPVSTPVYRGQVCVRVAERARPADAEGADAEGADDSAAAGERVL